MLVFMGSKGGCGRTTASLLVAFGLSLRGIPIRFVEVTADGRRPWIHGRPGLPFATATIDSKLVTRSALTSDPNPGSHLVVDLPSQFPLSVLAKVSRFVLPTRGGVGDIIALEHDLNSLAANSFCIPISVLPMGWGEGAASQFQGVIQKYKRTLSVELVSTIVTQDAALDFDYKNNGSICPGAIAQRYSRLVSSKILKGVQWTV